MTNPTTPTRTEQRRKQAFLYFMLLNERGYRYKVSVKKAAQRFFYSPATLERIIQEQRKQLREKTS